MYLIVQVPRRQAELESVRPERPQVLEGEVCHGGQARGTVQDDRAEDVRDRVERAAAGDGRRN